MSLMKKMQTILILIFINFIYFLTFSKTMQNFKITIAGVGGTGSQVALLLSRSGFGNIEVIDFDKVERHNITTGMQFYNYDQIGKQKVEALKANIKLFSGLEIDTIDGRCEGVETDVLILCVDSMTDRKKIIENSKFKFCIDPRVSGETFNVYAFYFHELEDYQKTWFPQEE